MKFHLPYSVGSRDLPSLYSLCAEVRRCTDKEIELDGSRVQFVDPLGLTVLGALLSSKHDQRISMPWLPLNIAGYLDRMNFFKHCEIHDVEKPAWGRNDLRNKLVELTCIESHADSDKVANALADAITGTLTDANPNAAFDPNTGKNQYDRFRHPIFYALSELIENSLTHARQQGNVRAKVWVASQYYDSAGIVRMAVVDDGCGMLATLANHPRLPEQSHLAAIATALIPKVSCNRDGRLYNTQGNQGVGLTTTAKIAKSARGSLAIASGDSCIFSSTGTGAVLAHGGHWQGVAIGFHCRRSKLAAVRLGELLPRETAPFEVSFEE
jgi:hypothetical protein